MDLDEMYKTLAEQALADGIPCDDSPTGPLAAWIIRHVQYREGTLFFIVFGVACALADLLAQKEGYKSNIDKALANIKATPNPRS